MNTVICQRCKEPVRDAVRGPVEAAIDHQAKCQRVTTFSDLADWFDKGWVVTKLRADSNGQGKQQFWLEISKRVVGLEE